VPVGTETAEVRDRGSRFLAVAEPAEDPAQAISVRNSRRLEHHDATHHVWAFRGARGEERWDDDGEPAGTGGRPILAAIDSSGLKNVVVVVTRWFGGTKLGTGGLARAYGRAAGAALDSIGSVAVRPGRVVVVRHGWSDTGAISSAVASIGASRISERFDPDPELRVAVPSARVAALFAALRDATAGRAECAIEDVELWVRAEP
jgi:putative IMPACT (imprinted ancient) family translation regulator